MRQHLVWLCGSPETVLLELETREQNVGGKWGFADSMDTGIKSRTLAQAKGHFLPGTEV